MTKREETLEILKFLSLGAEGYGYVRRVVDRMKWDDVLLAARKTLQAKEEGWGPERIFGYFRSLTERAKAGEAVVLRPNGLDGYRERKAAELLRAALDREASGVRAPSYEMAEGFYDPRVEPNYDQEQRNWDYEDNSFS